MKIIIIAVLITIFYNSALAQLDENRKAKHYFTKAQKQFDKGDYNASIDFIKKAENSIGTKVAQTQALRIKVAYKLENFILAKELFDDYTKNYMKSTPKEQNEELLAIFNLEEATEKDTNRLLIKINRRKIEVAKKDFDEMTWQNAKDTCSRLGSGWRLPSKTELDQMYLQLHKKGKGNFKSAYYWSSTEVYGSYPWCLTFYDGSACSRLFSSGKGFTFYVRAVRDL